MLVNPKKQCSGCGVCVKVCSVNAISLKSDKSGFSYPVIDLNKCIKCGLCKKKCSFNKKESIDNELENPIIFAAKNKDEDMRMKSSSGGIFSLLANYVFKNNGSVYGATFNDKFEVEHIRIISKKHLNKLRGSKYVESKLGDIFSKVEKDLDEKQLVLFSGTPCQIAGLKSFLGKKSQDNLIVIDLVCHGIPSPKLLKKIFSELEIKNKSKIKKFYFRHKCKNWKSTKTLVQFTNNKILVNDKFLNSYMELFLRNISLRESCFNCVFANYNRVGDITLGDFWGIEKSHPEFDDNRGVSLVLLNTKKGQKLFDEIKEDLVCIRSNKNEAVQRSLWKPVKCNVNQNKFWDDLDRHGYEYVAKKYSSYGLLKQIKIRIFEKIPKQILEKMGIKNFVKQKLLKYI